MSDFTANIRAVLDETKLSQQLSAIGNKPITLTNIRIAADDITAQIQRAISNESFSITVNRVNLDNLTRTARSTGTEMGRSIADGIRTQVSSALRPLNISNSLLEIGGIENIMRRMHFDTSDINTVTRDLNQMQLAITNIKTTMAGENIRFTVNGVDQFERAVTVVKDFNITTREMEDVSKTFKQSFVLPKNTEKSVDQTTQAFKELQSILKQISALELKIKGLDDSKNANQVNELTRQLDGLKSQFSSLMSYSGEGLRSDQFAQLVSQAKQAEDKISELDAKLADRSAVKESVVAYRELQSIFSQISAIELKIKGLDPNDNANQISTLTTQLETLKASYESLMSSSYTKPSGDQFAGLVQSAQAADNKFKELDAKINDVKAKLATSIQLKINTGNIDSSIASVVSQYEKLGSTGHSGLAQISNDITELKALQEALGSATTPEQLISTYERFQRTLDETKNHINIVTAETKNLASAVNNKALTAKMQEWLAKNTKAAKVYGDAVKTLIDRNTQMGASGTQTVNDLQAIDAEFRQITIDANNAGLSGASFGRVLSNSVRSVLGIVDLTSLFRTSIRYIKQIAGEVVNVDTSMTGLKRVTKLTTDQYKSMYSEMVASAKEYGATLTEIIDGTTNWVKLGFAPEISQQLANITAMYQHVTDLDVNTATKNLITAYKGFEKTLLKSNNNDVSAAVTQIADIYDKLGKALPLRNYIG